MPRQFRLLTQHFINDRLLETGTIIGEGTDVPFLFPDGTKQTPSPEMEGLEPPAQAEVDAVRAKAGGYGIHPVESLPITMEEPAEPPKRK